MAEGSVALEPASAHPPEIPAASDSLRRLLGQTAYDPADEAAGMLGEALDFLGAEFLAGVLDGEFLLKQPGQVFPGFFETRHPQNPAKDGKRVQMPPRRRAFPEVIDGEGVRSGDGRLDRKHQGRVMSASDELSLHRRQPVPGILQPRTVFIPRNVSGVDLLCGHPSEPHSVASRR